MAEETKARTDIKSPTDFPWAFNKLKLKQAYSALVDRKKLDSTLKIDEKVIKDEYVARKGLLSDEQEEVMKIKRPRSTSNVDNKVR